MAVELRLLGRENTWIEGQNCLLSLAPTADCHTRSAVDLVLLGPHSPARGGGFLAVHLRMYEDHGGGPGWAETCQWRAALFSRGVVVKLWPDRSRV